MIKVIRPLVKVTKIEKCEKCQARREWTIYESGMREKKIWSVRGIKCRHKWVNLDVNQVSKVEGEKNGR